MQVLKKRPLDKFVMFMHSSDTLMLCNVWCDKIYAVDLKE